MYTIGCAKIEMTTFIYGKGMMGYAVPWHVVKDVKTPIFARAFVITSTDTNKKVAIVNSEICFYTIALKHAVVQGLQEQYPHLGYADDNVLLSAQHTHSAAGGYSHYPLYNLAIEGFQPRIFKHYVACTIAAIVAADKKQVPATIQYTSGDFPENDAVAFNRSLKAYNANVEITSPIAKKNHHLAVDRCMKLVRFTGTDGRILGSINWFGVHTTSVGNKHTNICSDNKGYAAQYLEEKIGTSFNNSDFVGAFAQDTAGDISPNHQYAPEVPFEKEYESAQKNGHLQYKQAHALLKQAARETPLKGTVDHALMFVDWSKVKVHTQFVPNYNQADWFYPPQTVSNATGVGLLLGANDRPAMPKFSNIVVGFAAKRLAAVLKFYELRVLSKFLSEERQHNIKRKYCMHASKPIFMEPTAHRVIGANFFHRAVLPSVDPTVAVLKRVSRLQRHVPWMPSIMPLQIITIGELAIIGIAAEISTMAGKRLRETAMRVLKHKGIKYIVLSTYTNGYHGYITTPEEYEVQLYEGAHTIFGKWTLAAYQTKVLELARQICKPVQDRTIDVSTQPCVVPDEQLWCGE